MSLVPLYIIMTNLQTRASMFVLLCFCVNFFLLFCLQYVPISGMAISATRRATVETRLKFVTRKAGSVRRVPMDGLARRAIVSSLL